MKTNLLTKMILTLALCLQISTVVSAQVSQGNDKGNGGGGVVQDGRYMTFYSAGVYVDKQDLLIEQTPSLKPLVDFILGNQFFSATLKNRYLSKLMPSTARKYYKVQNDKFSNETKARLIAEYQRLTNINQNSLALFAITDIPTGNTYLLPEFYSLNEYEQMAILFHEAYWLIYPKDTYSQVVEAEVSFQRYLQNSASPEALFRLLQVIGTEKELIEAAKISDFTTGALGQLADKNKLFITRLFGAVAMNCILNMEASYVSYSNNAMRECGSYVSNNLFSLSLSNPSSLIIKILVNKATAGGLVLNFGSPYSRSGDAKSLGNYVKYNKSTIDISQIDSGLTFSADQFASDRRIDNGVFNSGSIY